MNPLTRAAMSEGAQEIRAETKRCGHDVFRLDSLRQLEAKCGADIRTEAAALAIVADPGPQANVQAVKAGASKLASLCDTLASTREAIRQLHVEAKTREDRIKSAVDKLNGAVSEFARGL